MDEVDHAQMISEVYETAMLRQRARNKAALPEFRRTCEDCGGVIPARRRRANPSATRCIACQAKVEHGGT
jgi:phage/conjugal plasmid C-4 type zinc finger TraR family protein